MQELLNILEKIVTFCENQGAEAEVVGIKKKEIIVTVERNHVTLCIKQHTTGIGIRTLMKNSVGFACCNSLEEDVAKETAQKAVIMSRKTPPVPFSVFAAPGELPDVPGLYDPEIQNFDEKIAISAARAMVTAAREDPRVWIDNGEFNAVVGEKAISTSSGISAAERKSGISWFVTGMAREHEKIGSFEYQYGCTSHVKDVYCEETAQTLAERALANLHPKKIDSFLGDLILGPEAVSTLIGNPLTLSLNANNVYRGQSVLAGALNREIASEIVTIRDHAVLPGGFNSSAFDREGTPHQELTMVKNGVLKRFMYDALAANREDKKSTGNATGTFRDIPRIGITNFMVEGPSCDLPTMIEEIETGLLVTRFSGTCDQISGDFSGAVKGAQFITSGEIKHPVKEATIVGNTYEILPHITALSRKTMKYPTMTLPYVKVSGIQVSS